MTKCEKLSRIKEAFDLLRTNEREKIDYEILEYCLLCGIARMGDEILKDYEK